jgi:DNA mismatch repair protein MutS
LTALAAKLPGLACHTMRVKEWRGYVVFLHEVGPGAANRSYGIHVGKLAGLPKSVTARAEPPPRESAAEALLRELRPDELTPREALDLVYQLKALVSE